MHRLVCMRILPVALASFLLVACGGGGGGATNARPVANAGPDQSVDEQVTVTLDGTASSDADGGISYSWAQTAGTSVVQGRRERLSSRHCCWPTKYSLFG